MLLQVKNLCFASLWLSAGAAVAGAQESAGSLEDCKKVTIDFVVVKGDPDMEAIEDDIRADLAKIGITANVRFADEEEYDRAEKEGEYNLLFGRTWGAPYDPHSYLASFAVPAHFEYQASRNLEPPMTQEILIDKIVGVQSLTDQRVLTEKWKEILQDIHDQAVFYPLWGSRIPYVINRRLIGFQPSPQAYSYPLYGVRIVDGPTTVTAAVGSGGALTDDVGPLHPHEYGPLFPQAWIFEGLVGYGQDGIITPALATAWDVETKDNGGEKFTFTLRQNVTFHDGLPFNCDAVKLNFDHVLHDPVAKRHGWMRTPLVISSWECNEQGQFVLETNEPFYPLLQELSYIRPLTITSPAAFHDTNPETHNTCTPGGRYEGNPNVTCAGLKEAAIGTGPFRFVSRTPDPSNPDRDAETLFARNDDYWGEMTDIEQLRIIHYESRDNVYQALLDGSLDMALGIGTLDAEQVQDLRFSHSNTVDVRHSEVLQHALLALNTFRPPTDDPQIRRAIIHAIDKGKFIEEVFKGQELPVDQLLPQTAPYCNVDLTPKWGYDFEKARLLNCPTTETVTQIVESESPSSSGLSTGGIIGIVIGALVIAGLGMLVLVMIENEKKGTPMFGNKPNPAAEAA